MRAVPFNRVLAKPEGYGRFSSPLRNSEWFTFHHSSQYTPSVSHSLDSSLREGAGNGCVPFNVPLGNRNVAGDFHRPYEGRFPFIGGHSLSLAFARQLPQRGSRDAGCTIQPGTRETGRVRAIFIAPTKLRMGYISPFNVPLGNRNVAGDFHRPYEGSEWFTFHHSSGGARIIPGWFRFR